jgi:hypothetical protein
MVVRPNPAIVLLKDCRPGNRRRAATNIASSDNSDCDRFQQSHNLAVVTAIWPMRTAKSRRNRTKRQGWMATETRNARNSAV